MITIRKRSCRWAWFSLNLDFQIVVSEIVALDIEFGHPVQQLKSEEYADMASNQHLLKLI